MYVFIYSFSIVLLYSLELIYELQALYIAVIKNKEIKESRKLIPEGDE